MLLTYYGDDFTGSTDALESLSSGGVESVLFVGTPTAETLQRYRHVQAFGIAGNSRAMSPAEMDVALPEVFRTLQKFIPRFVHYKVCSTFDSSPRHGSFGRAMDLGQCVFENRIVPILAGVPSLGRYCAFGNLFARSGLGSQPYRLDRHPTMRRHPVTPMDEADLRVHLGRQTDRPIDLVDILVLNEGRCAVERELSQSSSGRGVLFDTLTEEHLDMIGEALCDLQGQEQKTQFVLGSSAVNYALVRYWQEIGIVRARSKDDFENSAQTLKSNDRVVILSGSCSPVTNRQIDWALANGFAEVPLDTSLCDDSLSLDRQVFSAADQVKSALNRGQSVVVHTCRGPEDPRLVAGNGTRSQFKRTPQLGTALGQILHRVLQVMPVRRVAVVGGDTSGRVARVLEIEAVEMLCPLQPGAPLCRVRSANSVVDGLEITFKGGQVGYDDFFGTLLYGGARQASTGVMV